MEVLEPTHPQYSSSWNLLELCNVVLFGMTSEAEMSSTRGSKVIDHQRTLPLKRVVSTDVVEINFLRPALPAPSGEHGSREKFLLSDVEPPASLSR